MGAAPKYGPRHIELRFRLPPSAFRRVEDALTDRVIFVQPKAGENKEVIHHQLHITASLRIIAFGCEATHTPRVVIRSGLYDAMDGATNGMTTRAPGRLRTRVVVIGGEQKSWNGFDRPRDRSVCVVVRIANDVRVDAS